MPIGRKNINFMLSGLIGSILENRKLKIIIVLSLISLIFYFIWPVIFNLIWPVIFNLTSEFIYLLLFLIIVAGIFEIPAGISIHFLKRSGENTLWYVYFAFAIPIFFIPAFIGAMLFYMVPNFPNMYLPLIYLAGYVVNFLLYFAFNMATDRDPMGPVIVVFAGLVVVSMVAAFIALFAFNYPGFFIDE